MTKKKKKKKKMKNADNALIEKMIQINDQVISMRSKWKHYPKDNYIAYRISGQVNILWMRKYKSFFRIYVAKLDENGRLQYDTTGNERVYQGKVTKNDNISDLEIFEKVNPALGGNLWIILERMLCLQELG